MLTQQECAMRMKEILSFDSEKAADIGEIQIIDDGCQQTHYNSILEIR